MPLTPEEIVPWSDQSHTSAPLTRRPRWSWIPLGRPGRSLSEIGFGRRKENAEKVEKLSPLGCISQRQPEVEFVFGGCHLWVGAGPRILRIWPILSDSRCQVLDALGQGDARADPRRPSLVFAPESELLLGRAIGGQAAQEADDRPMGSEAWSRLPGVGLSEQLRDNLQVVQWHEATAGCLRSSSNTAKPDRAWTRNSRWCSFTPAGPR